MAHLFLALWFAFSLVISLANALSCDGFFNSCQFSFEGHSESIPTYNIGGPSDIPFTPRIVSNRPGEILGVLNVNEIDAIFVNDPDFSTLEEEGFARTQFKPMPFPDGFSSGIAHEHFQPGKLDEARGRCVRIYFTSFQILSNDSQPVVINNSPVPYYCVVFHTQ
ncbi:hypothetical protein BWQ96_04942 [Gracilariopsis chorda]|uniref:Uncharacterized protein n=1 Tax=Gracilariopsis chorda TaxID=448386 RepID=A0A2V3IT54_9FLOR|nr:hypothetical protein BWQ96_04942 [Gracilariopsis chorda]|eukprot:PXF45301.1 hypothetical protein BWQ96_04942 [Gracilariopsis chorda]